MKVDPGGDAAPARYQRPEAAGPTRSQRHGVAAAARSGKHAIGAVRAVAGREIEDVVGRLAEGGLGHGRARRLVEVVHRLLEGFQVVFEIGILVHRRLPQQLAGRRQLRQSQAGDRHLVKARLLLQAGLAAAEDDQGRVGVLQVERIAPTAVRRRNHGALGVDRATLGVHLAPLDVKAEEPERMGLGLVVLGRQLRQDRLVGRKTELLLELLDLRLVGERGHDLGRALRIELTGQFRSGEVLDIPNLFPFDVVVVFSLFLRVVPVLYEAPFPDLTGVLTVQRSAGIEAGSPRRASSASPASGCRSWTSQAPRPCRSLGRP